MSKGIVSILSNDTTLTAMLANGVDSICSLSAGQGDSKPYIVVDGYDQESIRSLSPTELDDIEIRVLTYSNNQYTDGSNIGSYEISQRVRTVLESVGSGTYSNETFSDIDLIDSDNYIDNIEEQSTIIYEQTFKTFLTV